jgi:hypothetical protein
MARRDVGECLEMVAVEQGWFCRWHDDGGWVPCGEKEAGSMPDRNRAAVFLASGEDAHYRDRAIPREEI